MAKANEEIRLPKTATLKALTATEITQRRAEFNTAISDRFAMLDRVNAQREAIRRSAQDKNATDASFQSEYDLFDELFELLIRSHDRYREAEERYVYEPRIPDGPPWR